jgi:leucyl-tRNA synthetase
VLLPDVESYEPTGDGRSPLALIPEFVNAASRDGRLGQRETDTMGGFACSSWYFLRFCDPHNSERAWDPERVRYWMPVDTYVGGAEHAVMHLLYARFWTKVLFDEGLVSVDEPFQRLMNQGQVLALTPYRRPREGERLEVGEEGVLVSFEEAKDLPESDVFWRWARMSKSKGNVVTPDEMVEKHGADALRIYELFVAPFDADVQWDSEGVERNGVRFLGRVFRMASELAATFDPLWRDSVASAQFDGLGQELRRETHKAIRKATEDIESFAFNTYVASLMTFMNSINDALRAADRDSAGWRIASSEAHETFILLLAPAAPFSADELWESLPDWPGKPPFTYLAEWPRFDPKIARDETVTIAVQVNGKLRDTIEVPADASNEDLQRAALASEKVKAHMDGKTVRKVIVVPGRLVNVVLG